MANTKQARKMIRKTQRRTRYNKSWKTKVKDNIKSIENELRLKNISPEEMKKKYVEFQKIIDKSGIKGVLHKNKTNRLKRRLNAKLKSYINVQADITKQKTSNTKKSK